MFFDSLNSGAGSTVVSVLKRWLEAEKEQRKTGDGFDVDRYVNRML